MDDKFRPTFATFKGHHKEIVSFKFKFNKAIAKTLLLIYIKFMKICLKIFDKVEFKNILHRWYHHVWPLTSDITLIFNVYKDRFCPNIRSHDRKLRIFLSQNFKPANFCSSFVNEQNFKDMFKSTFCSYMQIIKTLCPIIFEIFKI